MARKILISAYWLLAAALFAGVMTMIFVWTPFAVDPNDGKPIIFQKILYFHLPVAINTFLACTVCFVGGIGYLVQRKTWWDDLAAAGAKVAVVLCTGVLLTGMLWAKGAWNIWWTWESPRLTFSFMLWLLFIVYLVVRASVEGSQRRAVVGAVYGLIVYLDIPLVYLSARLLPDPHHPGDISLAYSMKLTLAASFVPITLIAAGLIYLQYRVHRARRNEAVETAELPSPALGASLSGGVA